MTTVTINGTSYDIQVSNGILQYKESAATTWISHAQTTTVTGANWIAPWVVVLLADGTYRSTRIDAFELYNAAQSWDYDGSMANGTPAIPIVNNSTSPATPDSPIIPIEGTMDATGHQIINGLPATTSTGFVILSQLTQAVYNLTTAYQAGDTNLATQLSDLAAIVAALPAGITMPQVQAEITAAVNAAVLNEALDDDQKQAIVDAAVAAADNAILNRLISSETAISDLTPRVTALEGTTAGHTAQIAAGEIKDSAQDAAIDTLTTGLNTVIQSNNAQNLRLTEGEGRDATMLQAITPVIVKIRGMAVDSAIGVQMSGVAVDASSDRYLVVNIDITGNSKIDRVPNAYRIYASGDREKLTGKVSNNGAVYSFCVLKAYNNSIGCDLQLN